MKIAVGKYIRTKFNEICLIVEQIGDDTYFLRSSMIDGAFTEMQAYIIHIEEITIKVANTPQELIEVGDLVFFTYGDKSILFNDIITSELGVKGIKDSEIVNVLKILTPNDKRGYTLLWVAN